MAYHRSSGFKFCVQCRRSEGDNYGVQFTAIRQLSALSLRRLAYLTVYGRGWGTRVRTSVVAARDARGF